MTAPTPSPSTVPATSPPSPLEIRLLKTTYLRGPNMWTYREVIETWLELGVLEEWPSNKLPGFVDRLLAVLPQVAAHRCGVGSDYGFLIRLREGTWMGHVMEHVIIELLELSGMEAGFGQTRETTQSGVYRMVFKVPDETVGRTALAAGHALMHAVLNEHDFDLASWLAKIRKAIDECYLGPSTAHIVASASKRKIPHIRLNKGSLVQLGYGARQNRIWTAETDLTSAIAEGIAGNKDMTKRLLSSCGVPTPQGTVVHSPEDAWAEAQDIGLPVVVKPRDGNRGRGVMLNLQNEEEVVAAYHVARAEDIDVIVERYIEGNEHRVLVVGGKAIAVSRGESVWVTGDGQSTVEQLIELQVNSDPRRGNADIHPLETLIPRQNSVIQANLQRQRLAIDAVPDAGRRVLIVGNGNHSIDCTDEIHPEVAHACALAARIIGLDIAGIDLVCQDIGQALEQQRGAVVEVNAGPSLLMHLKPAQGKPQPVGDAIVDHLFPETEDGRIPIVGVAGSRHTTDIARLVAWLLQVAGYQAGVACRDGLFVGARQLEKQNAAHWEPGQRLLINRNVEAAVFEHDPISLLTEGLAYDRCQVGIVTDSLPVPGLDEQLMTEPEHRFKILRTQVDVVLPSGTAVLHATDATVLEMADLCDGNVLLFAADANHAALQKHREAGKRALFLRDDMLVQADGSRSFDLVSLTDLPASVRDLAPEVLLAAVGAALSIGIDIETIITGLNTFETSGAERRVSA